MPKLLAFAGSTRRQSFNQSILNTAVKGAEEAGVEVTLINLADYAMPIFNQDDEAEYGIPERAQAFKELLMSHDGFLIATPEYNSSYPALLKNALDWASRQAGDEKVLQAYKGKVAGLIAASPGALGGLRALTALRTLLENVGVMVIPNQKAIGKADSVINEQGEVHDEKTIKQLKGVGRDTAQLLQRLS